MLLFDYFKYINRVRQKQQVPIKPGKENREPLSTAIR